MQFQYHLDGKGHSGRAVRIQALEPDDADNCLTMAAKLAGPEATPLEIKKAEWRNGSRQFIVKISDPCKDPLAPEVKWFAPKPGQLDQEMSKFFTSKDCQILEALYREYHEVTQAELASITGKMLPVSED